MRSKLFVPGSRPDFFAKALASSADAISFDLEDAVPAGQKGEARKRVGDFLRDPPDALNKVVIVRVNAVTTELFAADLAAIACERLDMINVPKVEEVAEILQVAERLERLPAAVGIRILVNIETPKGLRNVRELAAAHPRIAGLQIGYLDLLDPYGIDRLDQAVLAHVRLAARLGAAEAGIPLYDGAFPFVTDITGFESECQSAHRHGCTGKTCIHPSQVAIANRQFLPTPAQIARARRVLAIAGQNETSIGARLVEGEMVDAASLAGARMIVSLAALHSSAADDKSI